MPLTTNKPSIGETVVTKDGHVLGTVTETLGPCFKVDAPMPPGEWLAKDVIESNDGPVRLSITRADLNGQPDVIEHVGYHVHRET